MIMRPGWERETFDRLLLSSGRFLANIKQFFYGLLGRKGRQKSVLWLQKRACRLKFSYAMAAKKIRSPSRRSWATVSCIQDTETGRVIIRATLPVTLVCSAGKQPASAADIRA